MRFKQFYNRMVLEKAPNKFTDLPDAAPYGFWVSKGGDFWITGYEAHGPVANQIKNAYFDEEYMNALEDDLFNMNIYDFLIMNKNFIRVVRDNSNSTYYFEAKDANNISTAQKRFMSDLGSFYHKNVKGLNYA